MNSIDELKQAAAQQQSEPIRIDIGGDIPEQRNDTDVHPYPSQLHSHSGITRAVPVQGTLTEDTRVEYNVPTRPVFGIDVQAGEVRQSVEVDVNKVMKSEEPSPNISNSTPVKEILEGEVFKRYRQEKYEDNERYFAEKEMEEELRKQEEEEAELSAGKDDFDSMFSADRAVETYHPEMYESYDTAPPTVKSIDISSIKGESYSTQYPEEKVVKTEEEQPVFKESAAEEVTAPDIDIETSTVSGEDVSIGLVEEDEESTAEVTMSREDILKHLQKLATEKIKPVSQSLNISSFTIAKKATGTVANIAASTRSTAKWVLPAQQSVVHMKEFLGSELEALREASLDSESYQSLIKRYKMIYDHIVSRKPATFEAWLKSTPYTDIDHYFFAIFIASFNGAAYIPIDCTSKKCKNTFITDDMPILNLVKYKDEESKNKFVDLYQSEANFAGSGMYVSEVVPLSKSVAVAFKVPSIYNTIEDASLTEAFKEKYSTVVEFVPFIEELYTIDFEHQNLVPITYKRYPESATKDYRSKVAMINKVLQTLSIDEFAIIRAYVNALSTRNIGFSYQYPEVQCPKCGKTINAVPSSAEELVFTRYQLGALVNTSLK